ncbi:methyltransferase family protein [Calidithermus roseus]|uniref:Lipid A Kdo2 1-phosphate O-methyltransferase n=1 Tax=Calidithermus roseus TaxID=1644118 RepID=A0A399EUF0_9DEIN|nr:isoprenylcysteine carboxylmethyltransferase family protein [Calidithermus roseus]RIH87255.1 lipid A Kdo2 1-phosphate O-methyltransferase [Calidithermus roseus]
MVWLKALLFTLVAPVTVVLWVPLWLLGWSYPRPALLLQWLGLLPIALGAAVYLWCVWNFAARGQGTPAPIDPPKTLVVQGLYRWVRNPMYMGIGLVLMGETLLFGSGSLLLYTLLVLLTCHLFVILYEEPTLRRRFGQAYEDYCRTVPRWVPRFKKQP